MIKFVGIAQNGHGSLLFYYQTKGRSQVLSVVSSDNGFDFSGKIREVKIVDNKRVPEKTFDYKSFRVSKQGYQYFLTYKQNSKKDPLLHAARSIDFTSWQKIGTIEIDKTATLIPDFKNDDAHVMYFGEEEIKIAFSKDLKTWNIDKKAVLPKSKKGFDSGNMEAGNAHEVGDDIVLTYYTKKDGRYQVGAAIFDRKNPADLVWRSEDPIFEFPGDFDKATVTPLGSTVINGKLALYFLVDDAALYVVECDIPQRNSKPIVRDFTTMFKKTDKNPIIAPNPANRWESRATFNSAAVLEDGKVHFIYRALGDSDLSVLGYATSTDGLTIDERLDEPIYIPREPFETPGQQVFKTFADHFASGGGYGGVEDPRITKVDDTFYMTYVAFDGANPPRVALTSISVKDFLDRNWDKWEKPKLISAPGMVNKNAVIFPEKINGKYVTFHRIYPNILIDYTDDLQFDNYLQGHHFIAPRKTHWDSKKIGAGAPPIKTDDGWLFIYQSVGYQNPHQYKIGAMLLDKNNPSKVISRTTSPIVEPVESYENEGFKSGVAYPCGAVVLNNKLHVYYGGADTVVCAASAEFDRFMYEMKRDKQPVLRRAQLNLFN
ncbi:MAG TPA: hypothetical protein VG965_00575 [Patescibacteria group bacterium]|nr:hypothetical protein [Patescibacteria group bacterium]